MSYTGFLYVLYWISLCPILDFSMSYTGFLYVLFIWKPLKTLDFFYSVIKRVIKRVIKYIIKLSIKRGLIDFHPKKRKGLVSSLTIWFNDTICYFFKIIIVRFRKFFFSSFLNSLFKCFYCTWISSFQYIQAIKLTFCNIQFFP